MSASNCVASGVSSNLKSPRKSAPRALGLATAALLFGAAVTQAATLSPNTGSLGAPANGTNSNTVTSGPGAVSAGGDLAAVYAGAGGSRTTVLHQAGLNPPRASPFSVEFWAMPTASDNDDSPLSNRVSSGDRSGWVFFQRPAAEGWNLRMYNGVGSGLGWDLTGGTSDLNAWSHVVATWNGSAAKLYVNGALADASNDAGASGVYNASTTADLLVGMSSTTGSPYAGSVDEAAFYATELSPAQIQNHFTAASAATPGTYHAMVRSDGALLQLSNNAVPEPSAIALLGAGAALLLRRRAWRR